MANEYLPIANNPGANVVSQVDYAAALAPLGSLEDGYQTGVAQSAQVNKTVRQSSVMTAATAEFIIAVLGGDQLDDGDVAALALRIQTAVQAVAWTTGDVKLTMKATPDTGWLMCNDQTIGSPTSGATYANSLAEDLFLLLWNNVSDTYAPVSTGRGGSAAADWAANKRISLTKMMGRALAVAGSGSGLTARVLGENLGAESVALTTANLAAHTHTGPSHTHSTPNHTHTVSDPGHTHSLPSVYSPSPGGQLLTTTNPSVLLQTVTGSNTTGITIPSSGGGTTGAGGTGATGSAGSGTAHANMQPTGFVNAMIKL